MDLYAGRLTVTLMRGGEDRLREADYNDIADAIENIDWTGIIREQLRKEGIRNAVLHALIVKMR